MQIVPISICIKVYSTSSKNKCSPSNPFCTYEDYSALSTLINNTDQYYVIAFGHYVMMVSLFVTLIV